MSMENLRDDIHRLQKDMNEVKAIVKKIGLEVPERKVPDEEAESNIVEYVRQLGKKEFSDFEISVGLNLPVDQVARILNGLERKRREKDSDG